MYLKLAKEEAVLTEIGRLFQSLGPATASAVEPSSGNGEETKIARSQGPVWFVGGNHF